MINRRSFIKRAAAIPIVGAALPYVLPSVEAAKPDMPISYKPPLRPILTMYGPPGTQVCVKRTEVVGIEGGWDDFKLDEDGKLRVYAHNIRSWGEWVPVAWSVPFTIWTRHADFLPMYFEAQLESCKEVVIRIPAVPDPIHS